MAENATAKPSGSVSAQEHTTTMNSSKDSITAHPATKPSGSVSTQENISLGQSTIYTCPKDSSAAARVFSINELVTLILERVPVEHRSPIRRVSTTWRSIISKIGYTVKPVVIDSFPDIDGHELREGPRYEVAFTIRMNPAINSSDCQPFRFRDPTAMVTLEDVSDWSKLLVKRQEFITSPPVTIVMLGLRIPTILTTDVILVD